MNWLQRVLAKAKTSPGKPAQGSSCVVGSTQSGVYVSDESALNYSVVWACVRVISETVAQLPWKTYQKAPKGKKEVTGDKNVVAWLLQTQPNPEMTAFRFKRLLVTHALIRGNAYAEIERDTSGRPIWLWPIHPDRVRVIRDNGNLVYEVKNEGRENAYLDASDILHFRGLGDDDVMGASVVAKAKESIGLGIAMERFGSSFFGNGANLSSVVTHPQKLSPEAKKNIEDSLKRRAGGKNALTTLVFEEGMKYEKIGIPPEDAQFLESRQFQVTEICRWFRVPPHKVQDLSRATWNNIEHQSIEFVTDTIVPWTCNFEEEVNLKLFGRQNRGVFYTKFSLSALLRGDTATRFAAYASARQWGWLSVNDIRALEDMNDIKGGDQYLVPTNMTTPEGVEKIADADLPTNPIPTTGLESRLLNRPRA